MCPLFEKAFSTCESGLDGHFDSSPLWIWFELSVLVSRTSVQTTKLLLTCQVVGLMSVITATELVYYLCLSELPGVTALLFLYFGSNLLHQGQTGSNTECYVNISAEPLCQVEIVATERNFIQVNWEQSLGGRELPYQQYLFKMCSEQSNGVIYRFL